MRISEHGAADILLPDDGANTRQGDIEVPRLGHLRREEAQLHFAGASRLGL